MQAHTPLSRQPIRFFSVWAALLACTLLLPHMANGQEAIEEAPELSGLLQALPGGGPNALGFMKESRLTLGGWLDGGVTYNPSNPSDRFNGTVTFNDRNSEPQLNQIYVYLERPLDSNPDTWDFGGRVDFVYGTDAVFTQAIGDPQGNWDRRLLGNSNRFYQAAIPQAYLEFQAPIGTGLRTKLGHFYTIIGNESVMAPDNFFYSHSYLMQYGEPFTQTGALANYALDENLTVMAGAVTGSLQGGWDGVFNRDLDQWGFVGGVTWTDGSTTLIANATHGDQGQTPGDWNLYSLIARHDLEDLHLTLQHDYGWADNAVNGQQAQWYGVAPTAIVDLTETLSAGVRGEWFRDDEGFRVVSRIRISENPAAGGSGGLLPIPSQNATGDLAGNSYYAVTLGLNWKPVPWATVRPNARYDWNDGPPMFHCSGGTPPSTCQNSSQWLLSTDVILMF